MSNDAPSTNPAPQSRNWRSWLVPRFSLRTILIVITLVCLAMGLPYSRAERQRAAAQKLLTLDCYWQFGPEPEWLTKAPGYVRTFRDGHYFRSVVKVTVNGRARHSLNEIFHQIGQIDRVQSIDTSSAPVTHEHLARIAHLRNVKSLSIRHRLIDDGALANLRNWTRLEELLIPTAGVTGKGIAYLKSNSKLRRIDLSNTLVGDEIAEVLPAFPKLAGLEFGQTDVTTAGVLRFPDFNEVTWVDLSSTQVDDEVVNKLARFPRLNGVDLSETRITDFAGKRLARWPLRDIRLNETAVTDATLTALKEAATLELLEIRRTKTTLFGVRRLHELPKISSVLFFEKVPFRKNELRAFAGKSAVPIAGFEVSKPLTSDEWKLIFQLPVNGYLSVEGSNCSDEVTAQLAANTTLHSLSLKGSTVGPLGLAAVAKLPHLRSLNLANTSITSDNFALLRGHRQLQGITFAGSTLGDDAIPILLSMPKLRSIAITRGQLSYDSLKRLHDRKIHVSIDDRTMRWSDLGDYSGSNGYLFVPGYWPLTKDRIDLIAAETPLRTLSLQEQAIDDAIWARFAGLDRLAFIEIRGKGITDKTLEELATRRPLHSLKLIECSVTAGGLKKLAALPNLRYLHLVDIALSDGDLEFLDHLPELQGLTLNGTKVTDASLPKIASLAELRYLNLNQTLVTPTAVRDVISHSKIENLFAGDSFVADISLRFLRNQHDFKATSIDLRGPCFDDKVLNRLADYVWLREVDLNQSAAGDATLAAMSGLTDLQTVDLNGTKITDAGLRHMANWKHLRRLDLSNTAVTEEGLKQVLGLPQLRKIWLHNTAISQQAIDALRKDCLGVTIIVDRARY